MKHEYESFFDAKWSEVIGDSGPTEDAVLRHLEMVRQPDLSEFLEHQRGQVLKAQEAGDTDNRWNTLAHQTEVADKALDSGNVSAIASAFYYLGRLAEELEQPTHSDMAELYKAKTEKLRREYPLFEKNLRAKFLKDMAQAIAETVWESDLKHQIRLAEACEMVWPQLVDIAIRRDMQELMPDKASSLKDWLRPVAPEYARKGGRPKKVKK